MTYKTVYSHFLADFDKTINALAADGWVVAHFVVHETGYYAMMSHA